MHRSVVLSKKKDVYGPIVSSIKSTGIEIRDVDDDLTDLDHILYFTNKMPEKLETDARIGWWMCDLRPAIELGDNFYGDIVFLCNREYEKQYERHFNTKVYHLQQCGIDTECEPIRRVNWDVVFIGDILSGRFHHNRYPIISAMQDKFKMEIISGERYTPDSKAIYRDSPFCLSISPQAEEYTSNRTFNILSSGGFCLTLWYPGIEKTFENHKHLVWFKTPQEAIEQIEYYYDHEDEYEQIRKAGKELYDNNFTAKHRLEFAFDKLEK